MSHLKFQKSGEAKIAIYLTRRDRLHAETTCEAASLWKQSILARIRLQESGVLLLLRDTEPRDF